MHQAERLSRFSACSLGLGLLFLADGLRANDTARVYTVTDIGTLGGTESVATRINDAGDVTGCFTMRDGKKRAYLYVGGTLTAITTPDGAESDAYFVTNAGVVL